MNINSLRERVIVGIIDRQAVNQIANDHHVSRLIVGEAIAKYLDVIVGEHHHACACGNGANDIAFGREIVDIIAHNFVIKYARIAASLNRQVG